MDEAIQTLVKFLETASPMVWEAAQKQVQATVYTTHMWLVFMWVIGGLLAAMSVWFTVMAIVHDGYDVEEWVFGSVLSWLGTIGLAVAIISTYSWLYKVQANPLWYAILKLRELVP